MQYSKLLYTWRFSCYSAPTHWLVHGHNNNNNLKTGNKDFSLLHCNTRSLSKNLPLLNDILLMCKEMPSVIAISETKQSDDNLSNVAIQMQGAWAFILKRDI